MTVPQILLLSFWHFATSVLIFIIDQYFQNYKWGRPEITQPWFLLKEQDKKQYDSPSFNKILNSTSFEAYKMAIHNFLKFLITLHKPL